MVVKMKPEGSLLPGVISFAITPATNPMMIVQIISTESSIQTEAVPGRLRAAEISTSVASIGLARSLTHSSDVKFDLVAIAVSIP
jgi:hypothetical protein